MKIRTRLTLQYSAITALLLFVLMLAIYMKSEENRKSAFSRELQHEAITKANLFLNGGVQPEVMQSIYANNNQFINEVQVAIYEKPFNLIYHDACDIDYLKESPQMFSQLDDSSVTDIFQEPYQAVIMNYTNNGKEFIVTAIAEDGYGKENIKALGNTLVTVSISCLLFLIAIGLFLAHLSMKPVRTILEETRQITAKDFGRRLPVGKNKDEIDEMSCAMNNLLDRLQQAFDSQKMFVSNVSHELRTPMAALKSELEIVLFKERNTDEYKAAINNALNDARHLNHLIDGLLNLAKADYAPEQIKMEETRVDELLIDAVQIIKRGNSNYKIELLFEKESDNENEITVACNQYLLTTAFINLIENNCKFSTNNTSIVQISHWNDKIILRFSDNGIGISDNDKQQLFTPFNRGGNSSFAKGHGIGLALAKKVIELHKGNIEVFSKENEGTTFTVILPQVGQ